MKLTTYLEVKCTGKPPQISSEDMEVHYFNFPIGYRKLSKLYCGELKMYAINPKATTKTTKDVTKEINNVIK